MGVRLAEHLGICTSPTTLLRQVMVLPTPPAGKVSVLGIDDWSFRRGREFGTILVDLTTNTVIDLLPDRTAETSAAWMLAHPEIEVVSRDRGEEYASAARIGAPQAIQCADRFHLAQNLTDIVEVILARCRADIRKGSKPPDATGSKLQEGGNAEPTPPLDTPHTAPDPLAGSAHLAHHAERSDRYQQLLELRKEGLTSKEIARRLGMAERTIRRWIKRGIPYEKAELRCKRRNRFDPYLSYITERWNQGERNGQCLFRELQAQGYKGGAGTLYHFLMSLRGYSASPQGRVERALAVPEAPHQQFSAQKAVWLFVRDLSDLDETEREELTTIRQASPTADIVYGLVQDFMGMIRRREGERLDAWLEHVRSSQIPELQKLVRSIKKDKAAVLTGLTLSHNNGQVEGQNTKLKLIKRMMYGRAGFPLLRQRVLHAL